MRNRTWLLFVGAAVVGGVYTFWLMERSSTHGHHPDTYRRADLSVILPFIGLLTAEAPIETLSEPTTEFVKWLDGPELARVTVSTTVTVDFDHQCVLDGWGNPLVMKASNTDHNALVIYSFGPNGSDDNGLGDDIAHQVSLPSDED